MAGGGPSTRPPGPGDVHNPTYGAAPRCPALPESATEHGLRPAPHLWAGRSPAAAQHGNTAVRRSPGSLLYEAARERWFLSPG